MKVTFKKEPRETGLRAVGNCYPPTNVKLDKKKFAYIAYDYCNSIYPKGTSRWKVRIAVDDQPNSTFKWQQYKIDFETEPEAREWVTANIENIVKTNKLHFFED